MTYNRFMIDNTRAVPRWLVLLPLALALAAHLPALWSELVWDDVMIARQLAAFGGLGDVLAPPAGIPAWADNYYRPVVVLSYLVDFRWLGVPGAPLPAHLSSLAFHLGATWLLWRLARRLFPGSVLAALIAAALFATHPVHVESVNWVSGRSDVLATLLVFAGGLGALAWRDTGSVPALVGAGVALFLALLAKEVALAGLLVLPALALLAPSPVPATGGARPGAWRAVAVACAIAVVAYLALRLQAGVRVGEGVDIELATRVVALVKAGGYYLDKLVLPWPQAMLVSWDMLPGFVTGAAALLGIGIGMALAWREWRARGDGVPLVALAWIVVALAPSLWIVVSIGTRSPVAERYLYLPSAGFALVAGFVAARLEAGGWRRGVAAVAAACIAGYSVGTFARGLVWADNVALLTDSAGKAPRIAYLWHSLARIHVESGNEAAALETYQRALDAGDPDSMERARVLYGMGEIWLRRGDPAEARRHFERAAEARSNFTLPAFGIGVALLAEARAAGAEAREPFWARAEEALAGGLRTDPSLHEARLALAEVRAEHGRALEARGDAAAAIERYRAALEALAPLRRLPPAELGYALDSAREAGLEVDPAGLGEQLRGELARLGAAGR